MEGCWEGGGVRGGWCGQGGERTVAIACDLAKRYPPLHSHRHWLKLSETRLRLVLAINSH